MVHKNSRIIQGFFRLKPCNSVAFQNMMVQYRYTRRASPIGANIEPSNETQATSAPEQRTGTPVLRNTGALKCPLSRPGSSGDRATPS